MNRPLLITLLSIGTVAGFASGFHHLRQHRHAYWMARHEAWHGDAQGEHHCGRARWQRGPAGPHHCDCAQAGEKEDAASLPAQSPR